MHDEEMAKRIASITGELKEEYEKDQGDLFIFLFNYFFPQIRTNSNSGDCFCHFLPTEEQGARRQLEELSDYFGIPYDLHDSFFTELDISSMVMPKDCAEEEFGAPHIGGYGEDSDNSCVSVRTSLALQDEGLRSLIEEEDISQFVLIEKIMELFPDQERQRRQVP